jgi:hypothetical protein
LTALKSSAYVVEVNARGEPGWKSVLLSSTNGATKARPWALIGPKAGGVGRHWPISVPPLNAGRLALNPSDPRQASTALATALPQVMPRSRDWPRSPSSLSAASDSAYLRSRSAWRDGNSPASAVYAAAMTAARRDAPRGAISSTKMGL